MLWIVLGISSHFFWALVNIGDKYLVTNRIRTPYIYMFYLALFGALAVLLVPFTNTMILKPSELFWLAIASGLYFFGGFPYIKAIQMEEVTRINIWWNFIPLLSLLFGWFFLGEVLTQKEFFGFLLLIVSAILATIHIGKEKIVFSKAVWYMLCAAIAYASYAVLLHFISRTVPFVVMFIWTHIFAAGYVVFLLFYKPIGRAFLKETTRLSLPLFFVIAGIALLDHLGVFLGQWALALEKASLVSSLAGSQVLFVLLISTSITYFFKKNVLHEAIDFKNICIKIIAAVIMIVGVFVLSVSSN